MIKQKNVTVLFIALALAFLFAACGKQPDEPKIPGKFLGTWIEKGADGKIVNELKIGKAMIEWARTDEEKEIVTNYILEDGAETLAFDSVVTYCRSVFGGTSYKGDVKVKMKIVGDTLVVKIGGMKVQEEPGIIVTRPPEEHQYKKSAPQN